MHKSLIKNSSGFTYLQIMMALAISVILSSMLFSVYGSMRQQKLLLSESKKITSALDLAQKQTVVQNKACVAHTGTYEFAWTTSSYTRTPTGCSAELSYTLPTQVTIDASGSVTYTKLGLSTAAECLIVQETSSGKCRKITISASGVPDEQAEVDCACP